MSRAWPPHDLTNLMNWRGIGMSADSLERHSRIYEDGATARLRKKLYGQQRYEDRRCAA